MNEKHDCNQISEMPISEITKVAKPSFRINSRFSASKRMEDIFHACEGKKYPKGSVLVAQDEKCNRIFYLSSGIVEYTYMDVNGVDNLMEILGPGNMINLQPVFGNNPSIATFAALTECYIYSISKEDLWSHMIKDEMVIQDLLEEMALIIGGLNRQLCISAEKTDKRTLQVLYMLAECLRLGDASSNEVYIKLSQDDLARMVRTTRVTISKILSSLKQKGIVDIDYGGIRVKDINQYKLLIREYEHINGI